MSSLDFRLQELQKSFPGDTRVHVLLQFRKDLPRLAGLGFEVTSVAGDIAAGSIRVSLLEQLGKDPEVVLVGGSRLLKDEMDVSSAAIHLTDAISRVRTIPTLGAGALIGAIDSGFDLTHPCFRNAAKKTRILAAWDQANLSEIAGDPPEGYGYGVEVSRELINQNLAEEKIVIVKNHKGAGAHGTYVAGIAAGNGVPYGIFAGVAPEAEMILVAYRNEVPVGGSAFVLDALTYIRKVAKGRGQPVVINISQGDNLGAHDGTSLLERAIDNFVKEGGALVVCSAGNERTGPPSHHTPSHHARGRLQPGGQVVLPFTLMLDADHSVDGDAIDLWYRRGDRFTVSLRSPDGQQSKPIEPDKAELITFSKGNQAQIYSETNYPTNGDNRIGIILKKGPGWDAGTWELILRGEKVQRGDFDAWCDRSNAVTVIGFERHKSDDLTVTLPGNSREIITVGGFVSRPYDGIEEADVRGGVAPGSSVGPTRDGRVKPDLNAPSSIIMAPRMRNDGCPNSYNLVGGTSMAAPHVTGTIALLWSLWPELTGAQIYSALIAGARGDMVTGATKNPNWGRGRLNVKSTYQALLKLQAIGGKIRSDEQVYEFELKPQPTPTRQPAGMSVRIVVRDGDVAEIIGTSDGEEYQGTLTLRKRKSGAEEKPINHDVNAMTEVNSIALGGDECYKCIPGQGCRWYNPCDLQ